MNPSDLSEAHLAALMQAYERDVAKPWAGERNPAEACCDLGLLEVRRLPGREGLESIVYVLTRMGADLVRSRLRDQPWPQPADAASSRLAECYRPGIVKP